MLKKFYAFSLVFFALATFSFAQSLNLFYQIKDGTNNRDTVLYYLQNSSPNMLSIRAANFSIAFQTTSGYTYNPGPNNCVGRDTLVYMSYAWFNTVWTPPFTEACAIQNNMSLSYNSQTYNARFSYGISDFSFIGPPNPMNISGNTPPILAMKIVFDRNLVSRVYPENELENISNQFGDLTFTAIPYSLQVFGSGFPVEWAGFDGEVLNEEQVLLHWQTASEVNADYFEIEKCFDGTFDNPHFVGRLEAQGFSETYVDYQFIDESTFASKMYYRIKNVDISGQISYSNIIQLAMQGNDFDLMAYPNPTNGLTRIQLNSLQDDVFSLQLRNLQGQIVWERKSHFGPTAGNSYNMNISDLSSGIYLLEASPITGEQKSKHFKISKR